MEDIESDSGLQPDRDVFGLEKPRIVSDDVFLPTKKPDLDVEYAGLGIRILAYLIDLVLLFYPLYLIELTILGDDHNTPEARFQQIIIDLIVWTLYFGVLESSELQASIGKRLCSLRVIEDSGERLSFQKAVSRYLAKIISILPLGFGVWAIASDAKKQGWHDSLTGCFVIKNKDEVPVDESHEEGSPEINQ